MTRNPIPSRKEDGAVRYRAYGTVLVRKVNGSPPAFFFPAFPATQALTSRLKIFADHYQIGKVSRRGNVWVLDDRPVLGWVVR